MEISLRQQLMPILQTLSDGVCRYFEDDFYSWVKGINEENPPKHADFLHLIVILIFLAHQKKNLGFALERSGRIFYI